MNALWEDDDMSEQLKKYAFVAVVAACTLGLVPGSAEQLFRLENPSFEESADAQDINSDRAASWGRWGHWINRETGWLPTYSGECLIGYHHWEIPEADTSGIYQDVRGIPAQQACTFSVHVVKDERTNADHVELRLEPYGGGEPLASQVYRMDDIPWGQWKKLTVTGESLSDGIRVLIVVMPKGGGERAGALKFDEASLTAARR
jgi:hypothetical protein